MRKKVEIKTITQEEDKGVDIKSKKNIKKLLIFLSLIITIFAIYQIANIFALFESEAEGGFTHSIAKWAITVNEVDIVNDQQLVETFEVEFNIQNSGVASGKFSPGMTGYFEIIIEPKVTEVSVRYDIIIDDKEFKNTEIDLISVIKVEKDELTGDEIETELIKTDENTYTGIILLENITTGYFDDIKLVFKWNELEEEQEQEIGGGSGKLSLEIPITVQVRQYLGENVGP